MAKLIIEGRTRICGEVTVCGAKNAVLPILAASLLTRNIVKLTNCPSISDVNNMLDILTELGCRSKISDDEILVDTSGASTYVMPERLSRELRSSIFMLGPILSRFGKVCCVYPGGCDIGNRPIDLHLKGLRQLGVEVTEKDGKVYCDSKNIRAESVHLDFPSVGATENIMMAATAAKGKTTIQNAACEPEIVDLQQFMRKMGYNVLGAGTSTITIDGLCEQTGDIIEHKIIPDRIVAGTLLCSAAITNGDITVKGAKSDDLIAVISKLREMGCTVTVNDEGIKLVADKKLMAPAKIETMPHPGFPTDMQALMFAVCCACGGTSIITENLFENRFRHAGELAKMGASAIITNRTAVISGGMLHGATVNASDLRAGAALIIAALAADGTTTVECVDKYVDRGYDHIENTLNALGAKIRRAED